MFDRGEFCCKLVAKMLEEYGVDPRVIKAGRPQSNGQAEKYVGIIKDKMLAMMSETSETLPNNWDETLLHRALQVVRSDPHTGSGYAPGQILLGRPLVYPIEISKMDIDFEGTEFLLKSRSKFMTNFLENTLRSLKNGRRNMQVILTKGT